MHNIHLAIGGLAAQRQLLETPTGLQASQPTRPAPAVLSAQAVIHSP